MGYSIHLYPFFPCSSLSLDNKNNLANTLCFFSYTGRQHLHFNSILEPQIKYEITKQNSALKQNKNLLSLFKMKSTVFENLSKFSNTVKEEIFASLSNPD